MLGKTNAVSGKQKYGAYNIEEVEVDGGVVLEITDADEKPVDKLQLRIDATNSCRYWFHGYNGSNEVMAELLKGLDTSNVTDMYYMFHGCSNRLTTLDVSSFDTSKVTNMYSMFGSCTGLNTLDLSNFDTSNVTDMGNMFNACLSLSTLDLSNWSTSKVTGMRYMFAQLPDITTLDLSNFDTSNVTDMTYMFYQCSKLTALDLSLFNTSKVSNISSMFANSRRLTTIQGTLDLYSATNVSNVFYNTQGLIGVTLKNIRKTLQIGSGTEYGHLWELSYLVNAVKELWDLSASTQQTLTIGSANLEKIANVYVKLVDVTDEMTAQDPYSANKLPCVECESTDEGAMTLTAYAGLKNWVLA